MPYNPIRELRVDAIPGVVSPGEKYYVLNPDGTTFKLYIIDLLGNAIEQTADATIPPEVSNHITRTDNPHNVREDQIPDGIDYTLLFENALL